MFSYAEIRNFLQRAAQRVKVFSLRDCTGGMGLVLRHDVDLDIAPAFRFSQIEKELGIRSTYFILVTADTYNPAARAAKSALRRMVDDGFEIGLHFDPAHYPGSDDAELSRFASDEARYLSGICGGPVEALSLHNPDSFGRMPLLSGFRNAYGSDVFGHGRYSSDSRMVFRTDPNLLIERASSELVQLNLHPEHYSDDGLPYPMPQVTYIEDRIAEVHAVFSGNSSYSERTGQSLRPHVAARLAQVPL